MIIPWRQHSASTTDAPVLHLERTGMSDSAVPVGILAVAAARGVLLRGGQFTFGLQPEPHTIPGRLASGLPSVEGTKLNVDAVFQCVYEGVVAARDSRAE